MDKLLYTLHQLSEIDLEGMGISLKKEKLNKIKMKIMTEFAQDRVLTALDWSLSPSTRTEKRSHTARDSGLRRNQASQHFPAFRTVRGDFLSGPVAKTLCFQHRGPRFDPWSENWIPHAATKSSCASTKHPACHNYLTCHSGDWRSCVPQLRPDTVKTKKGRK